MVPSLTHNLSQTFAQDAAPGLGLSSSAMARTTPKAPDDAVQKRRIGWRQRAEKLGMMKAARDRMVKMGIKIETTMMRPGSDG